MSWFKTLLYDKLGITINETSWQYESEAQTLLGTILAAVALSDDDFSPEEATRAVQIFVKEFNLSDDESVKLLTSSFKKVKAGDNVTDLVASLEKRLSVEQKIRVATLLLKIIQADGVTSIEENRLFIQIAKHLKISEQHLVKAYLQFYEEKKQAE